MERIAIASDDGQCVSAHFSGAAHYVVITIGEDKVEGRELRRKPEHGGRGLGKGKPGGSGRRRRIAEALSTIQDCGMLVARSFGDRAYEGIQALGVRPLATDLETVDQVAQAVLEGRLEDHPERVTKGPPVWEADGEDGAPPEAPTS